MPANIAPTVVCVVACAALAFPGAALAAPPQCLTNLTANVFAGNPTTLPAAPCSDPDGDTLTIILVSGPDHGVLTGPAADGTRTYTAAADYAGSDVIQFKASDGTSESSVSTLTITVQAPPSGSGQPAPGTTTLSIQDGVLFVDDAAGRSTEIFIALYASPFDGSLNYGGIAKTSTAAPSGSDDFRAGAGCRVFGVTMCPAGSVREIVVRSGDGNDRVTVGYPSVNAPAGEAQPVPVPVRIDLGPGNDIASAATLTRPVRLDGGEGNDVFGINQASTLDIVGGPGADRFDFSPDDDESFSVAGLTSVTFSGGTGDDRVAVEDFDGTLRASGDAGDDRLETRRNTAAFTLSGGSGKDQMAALENRGPALVDAGAGNDNVFVSRSDDADTRAKGGISTVRAGSGDDTLYVMSDGDRDSVDCGAGRDRFRFTELGVRWPPFEDRYLRCPPIGIQIAGTAARAGRTVSVIINSRNALPVRARLTLRSSAGRRLATQSLTLRRGANRVRFGTAGAVGGVLRVAGTVRSATGDELTVNRRVTFGG